MLEEDVIASSGKGRFCPDLECGGYGWRRDIGECPACPYTTLEEKETDTKDYNIAA